MAVSGRNWYALLDLKPGASQKDIEAAYRRLARRFHPDLNPSPEAQHTMARINEAYAILGDPILRRRYDDERRSAFATPITTTRNGEPMPRPASAYALYPPMLAWSPSDIELPPIAPGGEVFGSISVRNRGGGTLSGVVTTSNPLLQVTPARFDGNAVELRLRVALGPEARPRRSDGYLAWRIAIEANGGEGVITVRAPYKAPAPEMSRAAQLVQQAEVGLSIGGVLVLGVVVAFAATCR